MLKIPAEYGRDTSLAKFTDIFAKFLLLRLLGVLAGIGQRAMVDDSGMTVTQVATHNRSENGRSAWDALYDTTT
jgi:hypothetical protein